MLPVREQKEETPMINETMVQLGQVRSVIRDLFEFGKKRAAEIGEENVFVFLYDWRQNPVDLAEKLSIFIEDAKELTGADKVSVYTNSYGAQVASAYLYQKNGCDSVG